MWTIAEDEDARDFPPAPSNAYAPATPRADYVKNDIGVAGKSRERPHLPLWTVSLQVATAVRNFYYGQSNSENNEEVRARLG